MIQVVVVVLDKRQIHRFPTARLLAMIQTVQQHQQRRTSTQQTQAHIHAEKRERESEERVVARAAGRYLQYSAGEAHKRNATPELVVPVKPTRGGCCGREEKQAGTTAAAAHTRRERLSGGEWVAGAVVAERRGLRE